jgi:hypothetical protein
MKSIGIAKETPLHPAHALQAADRSEMDERLVRKAKVAAKESDRLTPTA